MARRTIALAVTVAVLAIAPAADARTCRPQQSPGGQIVETPPPAALLSRLEVLRRPQSEADRSVLERLRWPFLRTISGPYVRVLGRTADDTEVVLVPGTQNFALRPRRCLRELSPRDRRFEERQRRRARRHWREVRLSLAGYAAHERGGWAAGSIDARALVNNRTTSTVGQQWGGAIVSGLAPDGVATIELTFANDEIRVIDVASNFWSAVVNLAAPRAFPVRTVWRAADGSVVKTFRDEPGR